MSTSPATLWMRTKTVWEEISGGAEQIELGDVQMNSRAYCSAFNFKGGDQQKKVGLCRAANATASTWRNSCARAATSSCSTNPRTTSTSKRFRRSKPALDDFAGCAVIISHDRFFLDRLCTHILAFEGEAHVEWFEGNFEAYEEDKIRRLGTG